MMIDSFFLSFNQIRCRQVRYRWVLVTTKHIPSHPIPSQHNTISLFVLGIIIWAFAVCPLRVAANSFRFVSTSCCTVAVVGITLYNTNDTQEMPCRVIVAARYTQSVWYRHATSRHVTLSMQAGVFRRSCVSVSVQNIVSMACLLTPRQQRVVSFCVVLRCVLCCVAFRSVRACWVWLCSPHACL